MALDPLPQQRLAIEAPLGPVLVVAGPGAGKTFCIIARINHLINHRGLAPERICAVTFTNRAAEEIAVRLTHTLGERAEAITRGTIHALCLALLRDPPHRIQPDLGRQQRELLPPHPRHGVLSPDVPFHELREDTVARVGGEEFALLAPEVGLDAV